MKQKTMLLFCLLCVVAGCFFVFEVSLASDMTEYICEQGISFYKTGRYEDALSEFNKILILDPGNNTAKDYVNRIFNQEQPAPKIEPKKQLSQVASQSLRGARSATKQSEIASVVSLPRNDNIVKSQPSMVESPDDQATEVFREDAMDDSMNQLSGKDNKGKLQENEGIKIGDLRISGEAQMRAGFTPEDAIWKRANWDLNEKNWRTISTDGFNKKENTYDPRIYDRLQVKLDSTKDEGFGFYSNITVDPWSFTGKSSTATAGSGGDLGEIELKYWSNTGYTLNEIVNTLKKGNTFNLPEMKVVNDKVRGFTAVSTGGDSFTFSEMKIYRQFQPIREMLFDYKQENLKLNFFPIAYENQAITFDDPLRLSNNHIWWEDSPWLRKWTPGNETTVNATGNFIPGLWDKTNSFAIRDSEGQRLTALRGFTANFTPQEGAYLITSLSTPKDLWQDYSQLDNVLSATRGKYTLAEKVSLGLTFTGRFGFNPEQKLRTDAKNYVAGADLSYEILEGIMANFEAARSWSHYDLSSTALQSKKDGNSYYVSLTGKYPFSSILNSEYGYDGLKPEKEDSFFNKFRFFYARMDKNFDQPLSSYMETRDDEFWSRHLHFRTPFKYYYQGEGQKLSWDDIKPYAIGNGIDIDRNTVGLRIESMLWDNKVNNLFDVRNVHATSGKLVENVVREEMSWRVNDKLTAKGLGIYQKMPRTKAGVDPFVFNSTTGEYYINTYIPGGEDPTLKTGSLGMEYAFFDWLTLNGVWEYTNDITLGYDGFPRSLLNEFTQNFLYDQQFFPRPPYPYYNIFKAGLKFKPVEKLDFYLDYTRNPYEKAGQVDDNMNHIGFEMAYTPIPKLSMFFKYTYSRWQDLDRLLKGFTDLSDHHNFFFEFMYRKSADEDISFQYGEASRDPYMGGVLDIGWDPYGGSLRTIDTQHIFRLYYRKKF